MEAPKGVEINAEAGNMEATCRTELRLESKDGEVGVRGTEAQRDTAPAGQRFLRHSTPLPLTLMLQCNNKKSQSGGFISGSHILNNTIISQTHNP